MKKTYVKKLLFVLSLVLILALSASFVSAAGKKTSGKFPNGVVWSFDEATGTLEISGKGDFRPVYFRGSGMWGNYPWYDWCPYIKTMIIRPGITSVDDLAFYASETEHKQWERLVIPDTVESIGGNAFRACKALKEIELSNGLKQIGAGAFTDTAYYKDDANWENGVLYLGTCLLEAKKDITACVVKEGTTLIADNAFSECSRLTSLVLPDSLKYIGSGAFNGCSGLPKLVIPANVEQITASEYKGVEQHGLKKIEVAADNAYYSSDEAGVLFNKDKTELVQYPTGSTAATYIVPNSVQQIDDYAFSGSSLKQVSLPDNVTFSANAFEACDKIDTLTLRGAIHVEGEYSGSLRADAVTLNILNLGKWLNSSGLEYLFDDDNGYDDDEEEGKGSGGRDLRINGQKITKLVIPSGAARIPAQAFACCKDLEEVSVPAGVKIIENEAFRDCSSLKKVAVAAGVEQIGSNVFANTAYIKDSKNWENGALYLNTYLLKVKEIQNKNGSFSVKDGTTVIAASAFSSLRTLISVVIPNSVSYIGLEAFRNCTGLTSVTLPSGLTAIEDETFSYCSALNNVSIPKSVTEIGKNAFDSCSKLQTVAIPSGVRVVSEQAFQRCDSLTTVEIPNTVEKIEECAFSGCDNLSAIVLPESLKEIGNYAFEECAKPEVVSIPKNVEKIGEKAFYQAVAVDKENRCYENDEVGALYNKETKTLLTYPVNNPQKEYTVKSGTEHFSSCAFWYAQYLEAIVLPESIQSIGVRAFHSPKSVTILNKDCLIESDACDDQLMTFGSAVIIGYHGSTAQEYVDSVKEMYQEVFPESINTFKALDDHTPAPAVKENETQATCEKSGGYDMVVYCQSCGQEISREKTTFPAIGHSFQKKVIAPTCTAAGYTLQTCTVCGAKKKTDATKKLGHEVVKTVTPATTKKDGEIRKTCTRCKKTKAAAISLIKTAVLSGKSFVCDGKAKTPSVTVADAKGKKLKNKTDYTVAYPSPRKTVGSYSVVLTFKGNYKGKVTLRFKIVPPAVQNLKVTAGKKQVKLNWDKAKYANGYVVCYATAKNGKYQKLGTTAKLSCKVTNLVSGKAYYFKVYAMTKTDAGTYYSAASAARGAKAK